MPHLPHASSADILTDALLVQASVGDLDVLSELLSDTGGGAVLTGKRALAGAARLARHDIPFMVDRRRYAGQRRVSGTAPFDERWLKRQRDAGVARVLTDSGYIAAGDLEALACVLGQTAETDSDVVAVLPLHTDWLTQDLPQLRRQVVAHGVPVAVVLEHRKDPLGVLRNIEGFVRLLEAPVPVSLLSSDVSALGALAFGARWAAVGVRSSLRHLYPATGGGGPVSSVISALVDPALALVKVDRIAAAWAATQDDMSWNCDCSMCCGRTPEWFLTASDAEATAHTFELLLRRQTAMITLPHGEDRRQSWRAQCRSAEFQYQSLALAGVSWRVPGFLRYWQRV
jgi:hypothetical protein